MRSQLSYRSFVFAYCQRSLPNCIDFLSPFREILKGMGSPYPYSFLLGKEVMRGDAAGAI